MNFETHTYQLVIAVLGGRGPPAKPKTETLPHPAVVAEHSRHQLPAIINPGFVENAKLSF